MNEFIVEQHNKVVKETDKVYFLGDFCFDKKRTHEFLSRMNGHKRLILGNHDGVTKDWFEIYFLYFEKIMESRSMGNVLFTHRPALLGLKHEKILASVFGHIHQNNINDDRYLNVSMEKINYKPISLDEIKFIFKLRGINVNYKL